MLTVLSPAKALDFETPLPVLPFTHPDWLNRSAELVDELVALAPDELSALMSISPTLGELNAERFQSWSPPFTPDTARPAALAFNGDTYTGLDARNSFTDSDFTHSQQVLRILSGLHGVLRPLDLIQPYRLEMGTRLATRHGSTLYQFWGTTVTDRVAADLATTPGDPVLVNLASVEYFSVIDTDRLGSTVVTPRFLDAKGDGEYRVVSFFAKQARGAMANWIIRNRITTVAELPEFAGQNYDYDPLRSTPTTPTFTRRNP